MINELILQKELDSATGIKFIFQKWSLLGTCVCVEGSKIYFRFNIEDEKLLMLIAGIFSGILQEHMVIKKDVKLMTQEDEEKLKELEDLKNSLYKIFG